MARGRNLVVNLLANTRDFTNDMRAAESRTKRFASATKRVLGGAAIAGGAALAAWGVDAVKGAIAEEEAVDRLAKTMENLGLAMDVAKAEEFIDAQMKLTGVADDELRPAFEKLVSVTKDVDKAARLLTMAQDLAAAKGISVAKASDILAKAANGSYGALRRVAPELTNVAKEGAKVPDVMKAVNKQFTGQQAAKTATTAGAMQAVATAFGEISDAFGAGFLDGLSDANDDLGTMDDTLYTLVPLAGQLGENIGTTADSISKLLPQLEEMNRLIEGSGGPEGGLFASWPAIFEAFVKNVENAGRYLDGLGIDGTSPSSGATPGDVYNDLANPYNQYRPMRPPDPTRVKQRSADADARAAARGVRTRANP